AIIFDAMESPLLVRPATIDTVLYPSDSLQKRGCILQTTVQFIVRCLHHVDITQVTDSRKCKHEVGCRVSHFPGLCMKCLAAEVTDALFGATSRAIEVRSEERRVGKECRERGSQENYRKNEGAYVR